MTIWSRRWFSGALAGAATLALFGGWRSQARAARPTHQVVIRKFAFVPPALAIEPGDTVRWMNEDIAPHTATATDASWDTASVAKGEARSVTFSEPGHMAYFCAFHPNMTGEIIVVDPTLATGARRGV